MNYRRVGASGLRVSEISLGGWITFGESITDQQLARELIVLAYDNGVNFFDIADSYAKGGAERLMGSVFKEFPRHTLVISSKVYWPISDDVNDRGCFEGIRIRRIWAWSPSPVTSYASTSWIRGVVQPEYQPSVVS